MKCSKCKNRAKSPYDLCYNCFIKCLKKTKEGLK